MQQGTYNTPGIGQAVYTMVPVLDTDGEVAGLVSVGIAVKSVNEHVTEQLPLLFGSAMRRAGTGHGRVSVGEAGDCGDRRTVWIRPR